MPRPLPRLLLLLGLAWAVPGTAAAQRPAEDPQALCRAAIAQAESEAGVPHRLMQAIARVESGRRTEEGAFGAWPWTINAEGRGSFFPTKAAAIAAVQALQAQGVRSIDVGCMQVNLRHHADAFRSLDEAFDPLSNARYAARFLTQLQQRAGDWNIAAGHYHSHTPDLAEGYRSRVLAAWNAERQRGPDADAPRPALAAIRPPVAGPGAVTGGAFMLSNNAERVQVIQPAAGNGVPARGLDAYRAAPIPIAGRSAVVALAATRPAAAGPVSRRLF